MGIFSFLKRKKPVAFLPQTASEGGDEVRVVSLRPFPADPWIDTCKSCLFFFPEDSSSVDQGGCRRFPKAERISGDHFCGEYRIDPGPPPKG